MEALFYIGQEVVALENHPQGDFKKGETFIVLDIMGSCCGALIRISDCYTNRLLCGLCGGEVASGNMMYYRQIRFAPIQEIGNMTFEEAIKFVEPKTVKH